MKVLDSDRIAEQLDYRQLVDSLREAFQGGCSAPVRQVLETGAVEDSKLLLLKPAWDEDCTAIKLLSINKRNPERGLPYIQGVIVVFDKETGAPVGVVDASEVTCRRTAAASALAADHLARADASILTIIGTGALSSHMAHAHAAVRPISQVNVYGRNEQKAQAVAARINAKNPALNARAVGDLDAAIRQADILSTVTSSKHPVIDGRAVGPGTHVDLVGAFTPDAREADDATIAKASVYVDVREAALAEAGDLLIPITAGVISEADVKGDLADLCRGQVAGRRSDEEITLFKSVGTALEDLVAAKLLLFGDGDRSHSVAGGHQR